MSTARSAQPGGEVTCYPSGEHRPRQHLNGEIQIGLGTQLAVLAAVSSSDRA